MNCPDCGSDCWDNRQNKRNPRAPDFKCKNKQCNKAVWETPRQSNGPQSSNGPAPVQQHTTTKPPLGILYNEALDFANKACKHYFGNDVATSDIVAAAATLFIQAVRDGTPIRGPKPLPAPPPPPTPDPAYAQSTPGPLPFD